VNPCRAFTGRTQKRRKLMTGSRKLRFGGVLLAVLLAASSASSQQEKAYFNPEAKPIPAGSKVYIAPIPGGFENFVAAGIVKKKVPVVIVNDRSKADYEISGVSESEKAGWAKMLFMGSEQSRELASVQVADLKTGEVVFAYSVHKANSARGKQSAGEACAKHLKEKIRVE
jgi:hypothetical protein